MVFPNSQQTREFIHFPVSYNIKRILDNFLFYEYLNKLFSGNWYLHHLKSGSGLCVGCMLTPAISLSFYLLPQHPQILATTPLSKGNKKRTNNVSLIMVSLRVVISSFKQIHEVFATSCIVILNNMPTFWWLCAIVFHVYSAVWFTSWRWNVRKGTTGGAYIQWMKIMMY